MVSGCVGFFREFVLTFGPSPLGTVPFRAQSFKNLSRGAEVHRAGSGYGCLRSNPAAQAAA